MLVATKVDVSADARKLSRSENASRLVKGCTGRTSRREPMSIERHSLADGAGALFR